MLNEDYKEMLQILLNNEVKFLIVGAYAMGAKDNRKPGKYESRLLIVGFLYGALRIII